MRYRLMAACLLLAAAPAPAAAQGQRFDLGFQLGYSRARFTADQVGLDESRSGSLFGLFLGMPLAGPLRAQAELFLAKKGGGVTTAFETVPVQLSLQLVYIEMPVLARLAIPIGSRLHPTVFGGGSVALNIGCDIQAEIPGLVAQQACDEAGAVGAHSFDYGVVFGAGIEYDWPKSSARLEVRRHVGLRDALADNTARNRAWAVLIGLTL
jgi:hypothetical protein